MTLMNLALVSKLAQRRRRRPAHDVALDINSDFIGRRPSGDPRLEFAAFDRG